MSPIRGRLPRSVPTALARLLGALALLALPGAVAAQGGLTLSAGPASWDLSGTGTGTTVALRYDRAFAHPRSFGPVSFEVGVGWFQDGQKGQGAVDLLLPEGGVRVGLAGPLDLGVGAGWAIGMEDRSGDDPTLWAALGANLGLGGAWAVRPEIRLRAVDPWVGTVADFSLGIRRALR